MIRALVYSKGKIREETGLDEIRRAFGSKANTVWVDVDSPSKSEIEEIAAAFSLHKLTVSDILRQRQRPKIESFEEYAFMVLRAFPSGKLDKSVQLNLLLFPNCIFTISFDPVTSQDDFYEKVKSNPYPLSLGPDYILYAVADGVVEGYFPFANDITDRLDALEDEVFSSPDEAILSQVFETKKQLFAFRKEVMPMRDMANSLARLEVKFVRSRNAPYFRDVYDHLVRLLDGVELSRDLVSNIMDAYLSSVSNGLNKSMKRIAAISLILMPPTLIASIFGMNFRVMPETEWEFGFYLIITIMLCLMLSSFYYFKREDWL